MDLSKLAALSPNRLLPRFTFWRNQKAFVFILLLSSVPIILLFPYTYPESEIPFAKLSILIHLLAPCGVWLTAKLLAKIQVENAIAMYVERQAANELSNIKSKRESRIDLDDIEEGLLPYNPNASMIRLFQQILKEAKDRKFESSINIMQPYREECMGRILTLQIIQKIALQAGVLGTFIGLILALSQLNFSSNIIEIADLKPLFGSLHISFGTSVAGLEVSLILSFLVMLVLRKQETYFQNMENSTVTMISLARNAINKDDFLAEFSQIGDAVNESNRQVKRQTDEIRSGIGKLAEAKSDFEGFLSRLTQDQEKFIGEIKSLYDTLSPEKVGIELQNSLTNSVKSLSDTFNENVSSALGAFTQLNDRISREQEKFIEEMKEVHEVLSPEKISMELQNNIIDAVNSISTTVNTSLTPALERFTCLNSQISQEQQQFIKEMRSAYETLSPEKIGMALQNNIADAINSISNAVNTNLSPSLEKLLELNTALCSLNDALEKVESQFKEQAGQIERSNDGLHQTKLEFYSSLQHMIDAQTHKRTNIPSHKVVLNLYRMVSRQLNRLAFWKHK